MEVVERPRRSPRGTAGVDDVHRRRRLAERRPDHQARGVVTGEGGGGTPVAVVRGWEFGDHGTSDDLFRDPEDDLVRGALEAWEFEGEA